MSDQTGALQIPVVGTGTLAVPPQPQGSASSALMQTGNTATERKQLICKDILRALSPERFQQATVVAQADYPNMLVNSQIGMVYGSEAIAAMNALVSSMRTRVTPVEIPQLDKMMAAINDEMRSFRGHYDTSKDPELREKYEKAMGGIKKLFNRGKTYMEMLHEDMQSSVERLDGIKAELLAKQAQLIRNVGLYDELYLANEQEIVNVIEAIARMEMICDLAAAEAAAIVGDPNDPVNHAKFERKRFIAIFANNLTLRLTEFKNRLFAGYAMSPQITQSRDIDTAMAMKLYSVCDTTIPLIESTMLRWQMMVQAELAAEAANAVARLTNEVLVANFEAGADILPRVAQAIQTPTITPETILALGTSIEKQTQGIIDAYAAGRERRAAVDDAIVTTYRVIQNATAKVSDEVVDQLLAQANAPLPAVITAKLPELPAGIESQAS
ncbi:MAG: toxic anion resistance protein [Candidatus Levybacteria bacterium]|nr:toxic anion resistance protein [Candidatus Levybacteria bacterium]